MTIGVLALFAGLTIIGIGESSKAALAIFVLHLVTLTVFLKLVCEEGLACTGVDEASFQVGVCTAV